MELKWLIVSLVAEKNNQLKTTDGVSKEKLDYRRKYDWEWIVTQTQGEVHKAAVDLFSEKMTAAIPPSLKNHFKKTYLTPLNRIPTS